MTGISHVLMGGSIAVMMGLSPLEVGYCALGAMLPDRLEKLGKIRILGHRTWTHEVLVWVLPMLACLLLPNIIHPSIIASGSPPERGLLWFRTWVVFFPGLLHLAGDVLTEGGIRVVGRRVGLGMFPTGHPMEYVVAVILLGMAVLYKLGVAPASIFG